MMKEIFTVIGGSVTGTAHIKKGKNNQDAFSTLIQDDIIVALVSDGSSVSNKDASQYHSEVGSNMLVTIAQKEIVTYYKLYGELAFERADVWDTLSQRIIQTLLSIAQLSSLYPYNWIDKNCLATLIGCIITPSKSYIIGCGDGLYGYNNQYKTLRPSNEGNYPAYLVYNIIPSDIYPVGDKQILLQCFESVDTSTLTSIVIGTDGAADLYDIADTCLPAQQTLVGDISQYIQQESYWKNPCLLQNRLTVINTAKTLRDAEQSWKTYPGLLKDDTTLLIIKKTSV